MEIMAFEVGKTYTCRSICDYECIFSFEVTRRSAQFVWLKNSSGKVTRRKVRVSGGVEACDPHGTYSMSPVLRAGERAAATAPAIVDNGPRMKGRAGKFEYWHAGPNRYEVRTGGDVVRVFQNLMDASGCASRLYELDRLEIQSQSAN